MISLAKTVLYLALLSVSATASASAGKKDDTTPNSTLNGSAKVAERAQKSLEDPLSGVIVNRTMTVQGHDR